MPKKPKEKIVARSSMYDLQFVIRTLSSVFNLHTSHFFSHNRFFFTYMICNVICLVLGWTLKSYNFHIPLLKVWKPDVTQRRRDLAYHVIGLKTQCLWVTLTSIPSLHSRKFKEKFINYFFSNNKSDWQPWKSMQVSVLGKWKN